MSGVKFCDNGMKYQGFLDQRLISLCISLFRNDSSLCHNGIWNGNSVTIIFGETLVVLMTQEFSDENDGVLIVGKEVLLFKFEEGKWMKALLNRAVELRLLSGLEAKAMFAEYCQQNKFWQKRTARKAARSKRSKQQNQKRRKS